MLAIAKTCRHSTPLLQKWYHINTMVRNWSSFSILIKLSAMFSVKFITVFLVSGTVCWHCCSVTDYIYILFNKISVFQLSCWVLLSLRLNKLNRLILFGIFRLYWLTYQKCLQLLGKFWQIPIQFSPENLVKFLRM